MLLCEVFAITTLTITVLWVYSGRQYAFSTLAWAMFFPGLFAPWFSQDADFVWNVLGSSSSSKLYNTVTYSAVGLLLNIVVLSLALAVSFLFGWGKFTESRSSSVTDGGGNIADFLRAAGEEIGWRCYLLPCLINHYGTKTGIIISGVIWAAYHIPVMVLLVYRLNIRPRWRTVLFQSLAVFFATTPHAWVALNTGFSLWAPTLMHYTWNRWNPMVLGSIYVQTPGMYMSGPQWLINGEGAAGCLAWGAISALLWRTL